MSISNLILLVKQSSKPNISRKCNVRGQKKRKINIKESFYQKITLVKVVYTLQTFMCLFVSLSVSKK